MKIVYNNKFIYTYVFFEKSSLADLYGFTYMDHIMYAYFTQRIKHVKVKSIYIYIYDSPRYSPHLVFADLRW